MNFLDYTARKPPLRMHNAIESQIFCGDCRTTLPTLPDASVHLVLSDIPYGINLEQWDVLHANTNAALLGASPAQKRAGAVFKRRGKPINGWSQADREIPRAYYAWCRTWLHECLRILKPGGSAILFAGRRMAPRCVTALEDTGFCFRDMLGWIRPRAVHRAQRASVVFARRGDTQNAKHWEGWRLGNLRPSFEPIIWCFKPYRITITDNLVEHEIGAWNQTAFERYFGTVHNYMTCGFEADEPRVHPAQKPLRLVSALIELCTRPGHIVLDPFAGSGTTAIAAAQTHRRYLCIERDETIFATMSNRVQNFTASSPAKSPV